MMKKFNTVTVKDMPVLLENETAVLLDCRLLRDYKNGHIENAMHAHDGLVESMIKKTDKATPLVIYCYHGHNSEHLAELFANFGFNQVYSVEGGYEQWLQTMTEVVVS